MWNQMPCHRLVWRKCDNTIQADSIQAMIAAAITGQVANHNEAIPCNPQVINSLLPSIPDTPTTITWSTIQSCQTCLDAESLASKTVSKPDDFSHLGDDQDPSLNPRCMTTLDWVEAQSKDKTIGKII